MSATKLSNGVYEDTIEKISKVGSLEQLSDSEIFVTLENSGQYSVDCFCYPNFENLWLNARIGSRVKVEISNGSICRMDLI